MLYMKHPVLAYRDYVGRDDEKWPFYWHDRRHINTALRLSITMLMSWQATRRKGGAKLVLKRLEPKFPRIVGGLQKVLRTHSEEWFSSDGVEPGTSAHTEIVEAMAKAVGEVAKIVRTRSKNAAMNPMLGSKVLSFFFPDFFPIWDTAWIKKALTMPLKESTQDGTIPETFQELTSPAARRYARYVDLMIADAWDTSPREYKELEAECVRLCELDGYDDAKGLLADDLYSLPVLFEACLLGRAAREGEL